MKETPIRNLIISSAHLCGPERLEFIKAELSRALTFDGAIHTLAQYVIFSENVKQTFASLQSSEKQAASEQCVAVDAAIDNSIRLADIAEIYLEKHEQAIKKSSSIGQLAANALHDKPGGTKARKAEIRAIWATGKYGNRDLCAEQECAHLEMSFSAARKALRNTPNNT
jgi:hypothetical protein